MRVGIVGCGLIGQKRARAALGHKIAVVADLNRSRADSLASNTGAKVAKDWKEVVEASVDVVIVATTHDALAPVTLAAVEAGKHVLVEKPAARSADEITRVVDAAKIRGCIVKVGFNHRFHPAVLKAHDIVSSGSLRRLMFLRGRYGHGGRIRYEKEWRCSPQISGGGQLIDQGSHLIDLSRWFLGDLSLEYAATPTYFWEILVEDNCFLALRSTKGQFAWLHASWTEWKNIFSFEIYGRQGKLSIEGLGGSYGVERLTFYRMLPEMGPPETTVWEYPFPDRSWEREFAEFESAIAEGRQPVGNIDDAKAMLEIIGHAYSRGTR